MQTTFLEQTYILDKRAADKMARNRASTVRAIDLYSGVGGWSLGLKMAGIDVVASYEWWSKANLTNHHNNGHTTTEANVRELDLASLPKEINIVVGSPPCTQFSFANRGGAGDIEDGLKDVAKFLEIVMHLRPKFWAMENVPRLARILPNEMKPGGRLERFSTLRPTIQIVETSNWGVPQRRKRCIAGNFDFNLLSAYKGIAERKTLGDVVTALAKHTVRDPLFGIETLAQNLIDHCPEEPLSDEEVRMNREMKTYHPVYNDMAFPDPMNRPARTITATCTRVSRESIVIASPEKRGSFRRLTVRERACIQGFPITYQFYGDSQSQKFTMIGNAVPPPLTFYIAHAMLGTPSHKLPKLSDALQLFVAPHTPPPTTAPDKAGKNYPSTRRFRAAIPNLRFKSGMRFELTNSFLADRPSWRINFFFGSAASVSQITMDKSLIRQIESFPELQLVTAKLRQNLAAVKNLLSATDAQTLQAAWSRQRSGDGKTMPYDIVDAVGATAKNTMHDITELRVNCDNIVSLLMNAAGNPKGANKVIKYGAAVISGLLIGSYVNTFLTATAFNKTSQLSEKLHANRNLLFAS